MRKNRTVKTDIVLFPPCFFAWSVAVPISGLNQYKLTFLNLIVNASILKDPCTLSYINELKITDVSSTVFFEKTIIRESLLRVSLSREYFLISNHVDSIFIQVFLVDIKEKTSVVYAIE